MSPRSSRGLNCWSSQRTSLSCKCASCLPLRAEGRCLKLNNKLVDVNQSFLPQEIHRNRDIHRNSQSSLFITKDRVILKTCGTALCLEAIKPIIELAADQCDAMGTLFNVHNIMIQNQRLQRSRMLIHSQEHM